METPDPDLTEEKLVREKMWVTRTEGSHLSHSQKKPGDFSPLTRDESAKLGHVTLSPIADDELDYESVPVALYVSDERDEASTEELVANLVLLLAPLVAKGVARGLPHAQRMWNEKARPAIRSTMDHVAEGRARRRQHRVGNQPVVTEAAGDIVESPTGLAADDSGEVRPDMSSSEAQARYLQALLARQFSDEQLRIITNANICEDERFFELQRAVSQLPPDQVGKMIEDLDKFPSLTTGDTSAELMMTVRAEHNLDIDLPRQER